MKRSKPCTGQTEFDWDRGAQLALLDAVPIVTTSITEGDGKRAHNVSAASIRAVLRSIDSHARGSMSAFPSDARLADVTDLSERQVRRAIKALEKLEYLVVRRRPGRSRLLVINWTELAQRTPEWTSELSARTSELSARTSELGSDEPLEPSKKRRTNKDTFYNKRAQRYYGLADAFEKTYRAIKAVEKGAVPLNLNTDELISLSSEITQLDEIRSEVCRIPRKPNSSGKKQVMSKPEMKKLEIPSPNMADCMMMDTFAPMPKKVARPLNETGWG